MPDVASGLRERKKARTREALTAAALELFAEQGFEATTVDQIAARAEVSRRTFFRYFEAKEAVVFPHHADRRALFGALLAQRIGGETALAAVRRALIVLARDYQRDRDAVLEQQRVINASPALIAREVAVDLGWEQMIADVLSEAASDDTATRHARMLAGAIMGVIRVALREWTASDGSADLVALGTEGLDLLARGTVDG